MAIKDEELFQLIPVFRICERKDTGALGEAGVVPEILESQTGLVT